MKKILFELIILLIVSSFLIFFRFDQIPKKLAWDEVDFARLALSLNNKSYSPYSELATGHSTLYFYILLGSIKLFGLTNFALRFPSAFFGIAGVIIFYLIMRLLFKDKKFIPLILSLLFVSMRWYYNFARFSFEATFLLFLELVSIYFFLKFIKPRKSTSEVKFLIFSAIFAGLAFLSYYPGRIFFLMPLLFLVILQKKIKLKFYLITYLLTFFLVILPLLSYLAVHKDSRVEEQLFLADNELSANKKLSYFTLNLEKISKAFHLEGDLNGRHNYPGKPILNPVIGAFFILGFLVSILNLKNFYNQFFLIFFLISILPAFFTYPVENPNILRMFTAIVPVVYFVGNGLVYLLQSEANSKFQLIIISFVLIIMFILASAYDARTYFKYQNNVFKKAFELNGSIKKIINLKLWEKTGEL